MTQKVTGREGEMEGEETSSRSIKTEPEAEGYIRRIVSCLNTGKITTCVAIKDPLLKTTPDEMRGMKNIDPLTLFLRTRTTTMTTTAMTVIVAQVKMSCHF